MTDTLAWPLRTRSVGTGSDFKNNLDARVLRTKTAGNPILTLVTSYPESFFWEETVKELRTRTLRGPAYPRWTRPSHHL